MKLLTKLIIQKVGKATKSNVDGTDHSDTATYDWNGTAWVAQ